MLRPLSGDYCVRPVVMHDIELEQLQALISSARQRLQKKRFHEKANGVRK